MTITLVEKRLGFWVYGSSFPIITNKPSINVQSLISALKLLQGQESSVLRIPLMLQIKISLSSECVLGTQWLQAGLAVARRVFQLYCIGTRWFLCLFCCPNESSTLIWRSQRQKKYKIKERCGTSDQLTLMKAWYTFNSVRWSPSYTENFFLALS